jgi:hypothetical protein
MHLDASWHSQPKSQVHHSMGASGFFLWRVSSSKCHFIGWSRFGAVLRLCNSNVCKTGTCCLLFLFLVHFSSAVSLWPPATVLDHFATHLQLIQIRSSFYPYSTNSVQIISPLRFQVTSVSFVDALQHFGAFWLGSSQSFLAISALCLAAKGLFVAVIVSVSCYFASFLQLFRVNSELVCNFLLNSIQPR